MRPLLEWPLRALRALGIGLIGLVLIFEEWGWEPLARLLARVGRLPGLRWIEGQVRALPPYGALALFLVPVLALLPVKLLALYWLGKGHTALGLAVIVLAKVLGTALTARLFILTRPTLMRLAWFALWFNRWMRFKDRVMAQVRLSRPWRLLQRLRSRLRAALRRLVSDLLNRL